MESLICKQTGVKVSSVLNRDVKQFGKSYMFDGKEETCWNSDQGLPQFVQFDFPCIVEPKEIQLKFQGGFVGQTCHLDAFIDGDCWQRITTFHPKDVNSLQNFEIDCGSSLLSISKLKLIFETSSDFYGRITVYKLDIIGKRCGQTPEQSSAKV